GGGSAPDLVRAAQLAEEAGADHIVLDLAEAGGLVTEVELQTLAERVQLGLTLPAAHAVLGQAARPCVPPHCLGPPSRHPAADWRAPVAQLRQRGATLNLQLAPTAEQVRMAAEAGADGVVLDATAYATAQSEAQQQCLDALQQAALEAVRRGLRVAVGGSLDE